MTRSGQNPRDPRAGSRSGSSRSRPGSGSSDGPNGPRRPLNPSSLWDDDPRPTERPAGPQPLKASWQPVPEERPAARPRAARSNRTVKRRSAVGWFVHRYGWRAYAIPVLLALTVVVVLQLARPPVSSSTAGVQTSPAAVSAAAGQTLTTVVNGVSTTVTVPGPIATTTVKAPGPTTTVGPKSSGLTAADPNGDWAKKLTAGALPPGGAFASAGKGTWHIVKGTGKRVGTGPTLMTYTVEVEDGITTDDASFAQTVAMVLDDPRSWIGGGQFSFQRVDSGEPDFRVSLTAQRTIRDPEYCGYDIQLESSCYNRAAGRVLINDARWERGAVAFKGDLALYRVYAINHEVGHALDFKHQPCAIDGGLAPVMMQQSFSTANDDLVPLDPSIPLDGKVCRANPYPYPLGAARRRRPAPPPAPLPAEQ